MYIIVQNIVTLVSFSHHFSPLVLLSSTTKFIINISGSLTVNITTVTNITLTGVLSGYTYIITVVPVNILGDGYPNKTIGYLNIIIKSVLFTSHTIIIPEELIITNTSIVKISSEYCKNGNAQYNL